VLWQFNVLIQRRISSGRKGDYYVKTALRSLKNRDLYPGVSVVRRGCLDEVVPVRMEDGHCLWVSGVSEFVGLPATRFAVGGVGGQFEAEGGGSVVPD
jgi:hypothetical protein